MMFLVMLSVDEEVKRTAPTVQTAVVADDFQILADDDPGKVEITFAAAAKATLEALRRKNLSVSIKKVSTLATSMKLAKRIAEQDGTMMQTLLVGAMRTSKHE